MALLEATVAVVAFGVVYLRLLKATIDLFCFSCKINAYMLKSILYKLDLLSRVLKLNLNRDRYSKITFLINCHY